jgi:hypothetical protein
MTTFSSNEVFIIMNTEPQSLAIFNIIDDIKRAHLTCEQLRKVLRILKKGKENKPRPV